MATTRLRKFSMTDHREQVERIREQLKGLALEEIDVYRHKDGPVLVFRFLSDDQLVEFQLPPIPFADAIQLGKSLQDARLWLALPNRKN